MPNIGLLTCASLFVSLHVLRLPHFSHAIMAGAVTCTPDATHFALVAPREDIPQIYPHRDVRSMLAAKSARSRPRPVSFHLLEFRQHPST
jgi:hypothetical protein